MAKRNNTVDAIEYQAAANVVRLPATTGVGRVRDSECQILAFPTRTAPPVQKSGSIDIISKSDGCVLVDGCTSPGLMVEFWEKAILHKSFVDLTSGEILSEKVGFEMQIRKPAVADIVAMAIAAGVQVTHAA
jgi:hypothetical protein